MTSHKSTRQHPQPSISKAGGSPLIALVLAVALGGATAQKTSAQWVVYDAATTARNTVTATLKEYLNLVQSQQHSKIREMARRLSALTNLRKYSLADVLHWRTHGGDFFFAHPYNDALIFGDPSGVAFTELTHRVLGASALIGRLDPIARRLIEARIATVNVADAAAIAATHGTGQLRFFGRKNELQAIDALESDVVDPSSEQSTAAVLDKISGASVIGARQRQARLQLLTGMLEQLLVDSKRARDTDVAAISMQLVTWRDRRAADEAFRAGSGDALRTWRQP